MPRNRLDLPVCIVGAWCLHPFLPCDGRRSWILSGAPLCPSLGGGGTSEGQRGRGLKGELGLVSCQHIPRALRS